MSKAQTSPEIKTGRAGEAGHWYDIDTGEAVYEVEKADGKGFRNVNLGDAKKWHAKGIRRLGCGVTSINGVLDKPELTKWKIEEAVRGAWNFGISNTYDYEPTPTYESFLEAAYAHLTELQSAKPGTEIHKAWKLACAGETIVCIDANYHPHVIAIAKAFEPYDSVGNEWHEEETAVHPLGYGCRVDRWRDGDKLHVMDIKSKPSEKVAEEIEIAKKGNKPKLGFDSDIMQLAANANALIWTWRGEAVVPPDTDWSRAVVANVFVGREVIDGSVPVHVRVWTPDECEWGWQMFQATLAAWKISKRYDPTVQI